MLVTPVRATVQPRTSRDFAGTALALRGSRATPQVGDDAVERGSDPARLITSTPPSMPLDAKQGPGTKVSRAQQGPAEAAQEGIPKEGTRDDEATFPESMVSTLGEQLKSIVSYPELDPRTKELLLQEAEDLCGAYW